MKYILISRIVSIYVVIYTRIINRSKLSKYLNSALNDSVPRGCYLLTLRSRQGENTVNGTGWTDLGVPSIIILTEPLLAYLNTASHGARLIIYLSHR